MHPGKHFFSSASAKTALLHSLRCESLHSTAYANSENAQRGAGQGVHNKAQHSTAPDRVCSAVAQCHTIQHITTHSAAQCRECTTKHSTAQHQIEFAVLSQCDALCGPIHHRQIGGQIPARTTKLEETAAPILHHHTTTHQITARSGSDK